jgi:ribose 5-phosphate isomerase A
MRWCDSGARYDNHWMRMELIVSMNELKIKAAQAALQYIEDNTIIGIGTGSTVNCFINELAQIKHRIDACVVSSYATEQLVRAAGIPVIDLNAAAYLPLYIDGADEVTTQGHMIKGGGGALTREKIVAQVAEQFICIVDETKLVSQLGSFPVAIEVIPMARSFVARQLVKLGGDPEYREGFVTDNGNIILDVFHLPMDSLVELENNMNSIPGVVENGLFARRKADIILVASEHEVRTLK